MNSSFLRRAVLASALLLTVGARSPLAGQDPPSASGAAATEPAEGEFFESIDVNVVNVDVYVTDKRGNRVEGLTSDDFELYEDRRPVKITNFYAVDDGKPVVAGPGTLVDETPEPVAAPAPPPTPREEAEAVPEDQRLHLVVYVDNWNIRPFNRNRVFVSLREFLRNKLSPSDRVMLVTYDREFHVRRSFTSDAAAIASALFDLEKLSANGVRLDSERREILSAIKDAQAADDVTPRARSYAESLFNDLSFSITSLKDLVESLAGLPGRKAILYVSDGIEMIPGEDVFNAVRERFLDSTSMLADVHRFDLSRRFEELTSSANANRISFYTLDAGGLRISTNVSVEDALPSASSFVDQIYWGNLQGTIQMMAERTGGTAIINTNDPTKGLQVVAEDFRNYYSLGYSPSHGGDGRYHKVEVRTKNKDYVVRHRDGYRDKPVEVRMSDGVMSALQYDIASNPLALIIDRGRESKRQDGYYQVDISVRIPIGNLVLIPHGDLHVARVRLYFAALDDNGGTSDVQEVKLPIEIPADKVESAKKGTWRYDVPLVMRRGDQKLAVGLRDEIAQVSSFAVKTLQVGG